MKINMRNQAGLTLPEVLVAMTLLALFFASFMPAYRHVLDLTNNPKKQLFAHTITKTDTLKWTTPPPTTSGGCSKCSNDN